MVVPSGHQVFFAYFLLLLGNISIDPLPILPDSELPVVIDRNGNVVWTGCFILWIVELTNVTVLKCLFHSHPLVRVELQQFPHQIQCIVTR